jgi:hypothetical protein
LQNLPEGDAHALGDAPDVAHNRHEASIRRIAAGLPVRCATCVRPGTDETADCALFDLTTA